MSDIVYVSPQLYLLSKECWKTDLQKPGFIPILRADVPKFQQSLQQLAKPIDNHQRLAEHVKVAESKVSAANLATDSTANKDKIGSEGTYQSLKQFFPIGLKQQLHTLSLQGVSNKLSNDSLKLFLTKCLEQILRWQGIEETVEVESWTNVRFHELQTQDVYFRLAPIGDNVYALICRCFEVLFPHSSDEAGKHTVEFHIDSNSRRFIEDSGAKARTEGYEEIKEEILKILASFENSAANSERTNETFLDQPTDYHVNLNTLSDLPSEFLPQLCKDIINFRTRVVSMEKEKRARNLYEESKRRKHQMMRMFDQIRKSKNDALDTEEVGTDESDDEQAEAGSSNEDDYSIEKQRQNRIKDESNLRYEETVKKLKDEIEPRLTALQKEISRQRNYEQTLLKERPLHLKELLHRADDPYYDHHRSFKKSEEHMDEADREKYGSQEPEEDHPAGPESEPQTETPVEQVTEPPSEQVKIKFAFKKAIDKSVIHEESPQEAQVESSVQESVVPDTLPFSDDALDSHLDRLKESRVVDELVKEYLGVYEDELVQYIFENIRENKSKQVLLDELKETFDEDAITIVDAIWSSNNWG